MKEAHAIDEIHDNQYYYEDLSVREVVRVILELRCPACIPGKLRLDSTCYSSIGDKRIYVYYLLCDNCKWTTRANYQEAR